MVTLRGVNAALSAFVFAAPDSPLTLVGVGAGVVIPEPDAEAGAKGDHHGGDTNDRDRNATSHHRRASKCGDDKWRR